MSNQNNKWYTLYIRWFCSTNAKDIGIMYLVFARWAGVIATTMSQLIRMEQRSTGPGVQAGDGQLYNVQITAHGLLMVFFVVMPAQMGGFGNFLALDHYSRLFKTNLYNRKIQYYGFHKNYFATIDSNSYNKDKKKDKKTQKNKKTDNQSKETPIPKVVTDQRSVCINQHTVPGSFILQSTSDNLYVKDKKNQGAYLAGFVEGDGKLLVPTEEMIFSKTALISICFPTEDKPFAQLLKNLFGGRIVPGKSINYFQLEFHKQHEVQRLIEQINGYFRTPKWYTFQKMVLYFNKKYNTNMDLKPVDESPLDSNAWLSGFCEADANFHINVTTRKSGKSRVQLHFRQEVSTDYKKHSKDQGQIKSVCSLIKGLFNGYLYERTRATFQNSDKEYSSYTVITRSLYNNNLVCQYFNSYPIFSTKQLNFINWRRVYELMASKQHLTINGIVQYKSIKRNHNSERKTWTWDHLSNFYANCK